MRDAAPLLLAVAWLCLNPLTANADVKTDLEYAVVDGVSLTLDAFVPEGEGPFPTAILVHGGAWTKGDKASFIKPLFEPLSRAKFTWFTINYRLAPQHRWPACLEDVERAIRWVRTHAKTYKVDVNRIALIGESAGGHLVSVAGARAKGDTAVAAVVPFYAPHDLVVHAETRGSVGPGMTALLGISDELNDDTRARLREASATPLLHAGMPPYLQIHGDRDERVAHGQSVKFCEQMKALGNVCELITIPGGAHGMGGWAKLQAPPDYAGKMIEWLRQVMQP